DSAYLVMRWLRGGTLERSLDDGPWSITDARAMTNQVGGALAAAHSHGIVHRDVKAANILLDEQGNCYLADFGIALEATRSGGPAAALSHGSPAYASPEQLRKEQLGPEADIFSLGVVLFECLVGCLPFDGSSSVSEIVDRQLNETFPMVNGLRPEIPSRLSDAVAKATAKDPNDRFANIEDFLKALGQPLAQSEASANRTVISGPLNNPYKGLQAFEEADSAEFFGRKRLVSELTSLMSDATRLTSRCVILAGPSGSGKSSVVRAGLLPALRIGAVEGSADWFITAMVPGSDPFEALEAALLRIAVNPPEALLGQLRDGSRGILRSARRCLARDDERVLLVVDQFEELFTTCTEEDARTFLDAVAVAVNDPNSPMRLVMTLRADYYDRPLTHPGFAPIMKASAVDVTPLAADELETAIVGPAERIGLEFAPGLVARIAAESLSQAAPLPLMQYALAELFERRVSNLLTIDAYEEIGGLSGALAVRAESLFSDADSEQQLAIRRVFGRLTSATAEAADLRRRVLIKDLGETPGTAAALEQFGAARLLTFDRDTATRAPTVEVAHEALLREWPRLARWLVEDRDLLRSVHLLTAASDTWNQGNRASSDLYRGGRLEGAIELAANSPDHLRPLDKEFIESARIAADAEHDTERNRLRRLRRLVVGVAAALLVALVATGLAIAGQRQANDESERAQAAAQDAELQAVRADEHTEAAQKSASDAQLATLVSRSAALSTDKPTVSVLLAVEAYQRSQEPATEQAVLGALSSLGNRVASFPALVSPSTDCDSDGFLSFTGRAQYGSIGGTMHRYDLISGEVAELGPLPEECSYWATDSLETWQFAISQDGSRLWRSAYGAEWGLAISLDEQAHLYTHSPAGPERLVMVSGQSFAGVDVVLFDPLSATPVGAGLSGIIKPSIGFSSDGLLLFVAGGSATTPDGAGPVIVIDTQTGAELFRIEIPSRALSLAMDPDSGELIVGTTAGRIITIDIDSEEIIADVATSIDSDINWLGFHDNGLVVAISRGLVELIDRHTGTVPGGDLSIPPVPNGIVRSDGTLLVHNEDHGNDVYDLDGGALVEQAFGTIGLNRVEFGYGLAVVADLSDGSAEQLELATGNRSSVELVTPDGEPFIALAVSPRPDGFLGFAADLRVARFRGGAMTQQISPASEQGVVITKGAGHEGRVALIGDRRGGSQEIHLINTNDDDMAVLLTIETSRAAATYPSPNDGLYVIFDDGLLATYSPGGELVDKIETGMFSAEWADFDERTGLLAFGGFGGAILVNPLTKQVQTLTDLNAVSGLSFLRDGELLVLTGRDGTVRLWDVGRSQSLGVIWKGGGLAIGTPWYEQESDSLWVSTSGQVLRLPLSPQRWVERACEIVARDLTPQEWAEFVPGDEPWSPTCTGRS
ncbi:MAG: protein kinase, partial [Acidimicrobiales bacterium]